MTQALAVTYSMTYRTSWNRIRPGTGRSVASIFDGLGLNDNQLKDCEKRLKECEKRHIEDGREKNAKIEALKHMSTLKGDIH